MYGEPRAEGESGLLGRGVVLVVQHVPVEWASLLHRQQGPLAVLVNWRIA